MVETVMNAFDQYVRAAISHERAARIDAAWANLEAAHIVGQRHTGLHVRSHVLMLGLAIRTRNIREVLGQIPRIAAASIITPLWVPIGNSGRANVPAWRPAEIPEDLRAVTSPVKSQSK